MCGIAGAFSFSSELGPEQLRVVASLNAHMRTRGPDGARVWTSEDRTTILAHRRLAIIDTGESGVQPMSDVTGRWTATLNGEIYNYRAVRADLERLGYRFRTNSDTEVLINAVAEWGEEGFNRLRGMYAVALWDAENKELWLARDPYGIRPLYIAQAGDIVWFASQARALADCAPVNTHRDAAALAGFYLWGHVPEPFSWWAGISALPPGHVLRIAKARKIFSPKPFYSILDAYVARQPAQPRALREVLSDSVRHHLVADVDVGIFLSGGIDSGVIASLARESHGRLRTITLAFDEYKGTSDDEAPLAEMTARVVGSEHTTVRIGREEFESLLEDFFQRMDQPTIDALNTYLVARAASRLGLRVALSGLGGDELFGSYPSFRQLPLLVYLGKSPWVPRLGRVVQSALRERLPRSVSPKPVSAFAYSGNLASAYLLRRSLYLTEELATLLDESWLSEGLEKLAEANCVENILAPLARAGVPLYAQISALESSCYMRNQLLRDADWAGLAHGVEIRVPFVDCKVLEHLAPSIASRAPPTKSQLMDCAPALPQAVRSHRKTGFTTPVRKWTASDPGFGPRGLRAWADTVHRTLRTQVSAGTSTRSDSVKDAA